MGNLLFNTWLDNLEPKSTIQTMIQIALNGRFSPQKWDELKALTKKHDYQLFEYKTASYDTKEIVRIALENFNTLEFLRDWLLGKGFEKFLNFFVAQIKSEKPNADIQIGIRSYFKEKDRKYSLNIGLPKEIDANILFNYESEIEKIILTAEDKDIISIAWDQEKREVKVIRFKNDLL